MIIIINNNISMKGLPRAGVQRCNGDIMLSLPTTLTRHSFTLRILFGFFLWFFVFFVIYFVLCPLSLCPSVPEKKDQENMKLCQSLQPTFLEG